MYLVFGFFCVYYYLWYFSFLSIFSAVSAISDDVVSIQEYFYFNIFIFYTTNVWSGLVFSFVFFFILSIYIEKRGLKLLVVSFIVHLYTSSNSAIETFDYLYYVHWCLHLL